MSILQRNTGGQVHRKSRSRRADGAGLCELVQHLAIADYVAINGSMQDRAIEFVDHLHEHFARVQIIGLQSARRNSSPDPSCVCTGFKYEG